MTTTYLLATFVRVVELPGDPISVHLVAEVSRLTGPGDPPDYRAPTTICGQAGYQATTRETAACPECERGCSEAMPSALAAARAALLAGGAG